MLWLELLGKLFVDRFGKREEHYKFLKARVERLETIEIERRNQEMDQSFLVGTLTGVIATIILFRIRT